MKGPGGILLAGLSAPLRRLPAFLAHALLPLIVLVIFRLYGREILPIHWDPTIHRLADLAVTCLAQGIFLLGWYRHLMERRGASWPLLYFMAGYGAIFALQELFNYMVGGLTARLADYMLSASAGGQFTPANLVLLGFAGLFLSGIAYWLVFRLSLGLPGRAVDETVTLDAAWHLGGLAPIKVALMAGGLFLAEFLAIDFVNMAPALFPGVWNIYDATLYRAISLFQFAVSFYMLGAMAATITAYIRSCTAAPSAPYPEA